MFEHLIESKRKADVKRGMSTGFFSLVMHGGIIAGAVYATITAGPNEDAGALDTMMVYVNQQQEEEKPPEPEPVILDVQQMKGFQTIVAPTEIPTDIPPIDLQENFDPKNYSGVGVEGGVATGAVLSDQVYLESVVEEKPERLTGPGLQYPDLLRQAGVQGRVLVEGVIDTTGRVIPSTVRVVQTPHAGFDDAARRVMLQSLFRPGRVGGRAVKVLVRLPVDFTLKK